MTTSPTPAHRRLPRAARLALVGATVAAGAAGFAVLGAGTALAQTPPATLAVTHDHSPAPDHGSTDTHPPRTTGDVSLDQASANPVERPASKDLSADRQEHKSAAVGQPRESGRSIDRTGTTGPAATFDR